MGLNGSTPYEIIEMLFVENLVPRTIENFTFLVLVIQSEMNLKSLEKYDIAFEYLFPKVNPLIPLFVLGSKIEFFKNQIQ